MLKKEDLLNHLYYKKLPQVYRDFDLSINQNKPLYRYLQALIEGGYGEMLEDTNNFLKLVDPEKCPEEFLPTFMECFGLEYFPDIAPQYQRKFLANIGGLIQRRGLYAGVRFLVRTLTGLDVDLEYLRGEYNGQQGRHLIVTILAKSIPDLRNMGTNIFVVERYLQTQIPYYIYPHTTSRVATVEMREPNYWGFAMEYTLMYKVPKYEG